MERIYKVMNHPLFLDTMDKIEEAEKDRYFCRHDMTHLLDVARIIYIQVLEQGIDIDKELIYAVALLHDIGRYKQYEENIPHSVAGAEIAIKVMEDCGFCHEDCSRAADAIRAHRTNGENGDVLAHLLYKADKLSRDCYRCKAWKECYWSNEQKNDKVVY